MRELIKKTVEEIYAIELKKVDVGNVELSFSDDIPSIAHCKYDVATTIFGDVIRVYDVDGIAINLKAIEANITTTYAPWIRKKALRYFVRFLVRHELRHAWQVVHNKEMLIKSAASNKFNAVSMISGYGKQEHEADANRYAREYRTGSKFGDVVIDACILEQEVYGKTFVTKEDSDKLRAIGLKILKYSALPFLAK